MPKDSPDSPGPDLPRRSPTRQDSSEERLLAERLQASAILESLAEGVMGVYAGEGQGAGVYL